MRRANPGTRTAATRVEPAERMPAAERAALHLRQLLFSGALRAGDRVDQNEIASELGISRQPVREAVLELASDGLFLVRPHHGVFVGRFDAETVRGHYELNGYLEAYAAAKVSVAADPATIERLGQLHQGFLATRDPAEAQAAVTEFYRTINVAAGNPRLHNALGILQRFVPGNIFVLYPPMLDNARKWGGEVLRAIEERDAEAASTACITQWREGGEIIVADLVARGIVTDVHSGPSTRSRGRRH